MKNILQILSFFFFTTFTQAQVLTNFDNDSLDYWRSEGDGRYYLELSFGNPGNCMRVDDDATGNTNLAIAPVQFLGNWSTADTTDSVMTDIFLHLINGSQTANLWAFRISGPNGSATGPPITPVIDQWNHIAVSMDSTYWNVTSGTWTGLLNYINHFEVRAEYVNGDEYVRLDNIALTFAPVIVPVMTPVSSGFEQGSYEGWTFENSGGISLPTSGGNPGRYVRIADGTGLTQAIAPPKYLGDWHQVDETAAIMFDIKVSNFSGDFLKSDFIIKITGPGGEATMPMDSSVIEAFNHWHTLSFLIAKDKWTLASGNWESLIADIRELRLMVEYINGSEIVWFDNFRISDSPPVADFSAEPLYLFAGEETEVRFSDLSVNAPDSWNWKFGDDGSSTDESPVYSYSLAGLYDVELEVSNHFGSDILLKEDYIEVAGISDSILFEDDFNDNGIHPAWRFRNGTWVEQNETMVQNSNYYSGGYIGGCYALAGSPLWKNYKLMVDFKSSDNDKIGIVFNYRDATNFYMFTWQKEGTHRAIKRFVDGVQTNLAVDTLGYITNQWYNLSLSAVDGQILVLVDSIQVFSIIDTTFMSGRAGLYCHGNQSSFWDNFKVENLDYISSILPDFYPANARTYTLDQNYPNPFNPSTVISWHLAVSSHVNLAIFNVLGKKVATLVSEKQAEGNHHVEWDASGLASGVYFYKIQAGSFNQTKKLILIK